MPLILVIDDDGVTREAMEALLEHAGFDVCLAADGIEGADRWTIMRPDLVITDLQMPRRDGLQIIRLLQRELPDVPVIACSGCHRGNHRDELDEAARLGAVPLRKPVDAMELVALAKAAIRRR